MRVRAVAAGTEQSNAVGTVELECTPSGLLIVYVGVGAFTEGYAPGALTSGTHVLVPWAAVHEARMEGEQIFLTLDGTVTPHNRLVLTKFSSGDCVHEPEFARQRLVIKLGALGVAGVLAIVSSIAISQFNANAGAALAIAVGLTAAALVLAVGLAAERRLGIATTTAAPAHAVFAYSLAQYLPSFPVTSASPRPTPPPFVLPDFAAALPRTTQAIVITLTSGMLGSVLTAKYVLSRPEDDRPSARASAVVFEPITPSRPEPPSAVAAPLPVRAPRRLEASPASGASPAADGALRVLERCICHRADSVLWAKPIPRLSLVVLAKRSRTKGQHQELELSVAAINNGDRDLNELSMLVQFFEREPAPSNARRPVDHRPLYFEGPLAPGAAIKWTMEARGREFELQNPVASDIGPGGESMAPKAALADLLNAKHRPVRMHGAMMLAYAGDPRAREAALKLKEALREDEAPYLERILSAAAEVRACDVEVTGTGETRNVNACVYNAGRELRTHLGLEVRALEALPDTSDPLGEPPNVLHEQSFELPAELAPESGVRVAGTLHLPENGAAAAAFEVLADRFDLLH